MTITKEHIARFGLGAIGCVYTLVGILTALAAFNMGGVKAGTKGAIDFIGNQYLGKLFLILIILGLFSYVFWRFYQTFFDSRELGKDLKGLFTRAGYFSGGLFYGSLGFISIKLLFGGGYDENQDMITQLLNTEYDGIISVLLGIILGGKSIFELYFILSKEFRKNVQSSEMPSKAKKLLLNFGVIGHLARAVVFGIMSFLTIRTGVTLRREEMSTVSDAFQFISFEFGALILGVVASGLLCYGLYMFVKARYLYINI